MSLLDKGESVLAWTKTAAVLLLVGALLVLGWWALGERRAKLDTQAALIKEREAAAIDRAGLERVNQTTRAEFQAKIEEATQGSATLAAALKSALSKLRDPRVIAVLSASTGARPVEPATGQAPQPGASPACVLTEADQGEIEVREATIETQVGNRVVVGAAEAYRSSPRRYLFGGSFSVPLTEATEIAPVPARKPGWGAGPLAGFSSAGGQMGIVVATPEGKLPLLGGSVFGLAQGLGGSGQFTLSAGLVWRP